MLMKENFFHLSSPQWFGHCKHSIVLSIEYCNFNQFISSKVFMEFLVKLGIYSLLEPFQSICPVTCYLLTLKKETNEAHFGFLKFFLFPLQTFVYK